jgi:hypothetical protein
MPYFIYVENCFVVDEDEFEDVPNSEDLKYTAYELLTEAIAKSQIIFNIEHED